MFVEKLDFIFYKPIYTKNSIFLTSLQNETNEKIIVKSCISTSTWNT